MMRWRCVHVLVLVCVGVGVVTSADSEDSTLVPGASGPAVVETTISRLQVSCIFPDDKMLIRRIAYVESSDGEDPATFRDGYHGGIWQVDENMYEVTKSKQADAFLKLYKKEIEEEFDIKWDKSSWEDLRMSLYSAIAAKMYILYNSREDKHGIPRDIESQAEFWKKYYRPGGDVNEFITDAEHLEKGCHGVAVDMVFVLDGSSSVVNNFEQITQFTKDVIEGFDIGEDATRVGMIQYSTESSVQFYLNSYYDKDEMMRQIDTLTVQGGWTYTDKALDQMLIEVFTAENGARPINKGYAKVAIILTDGESTDPEMTIEQSQRVHDAGITVFAIGVGSELNMEELVAIASEPTCMHLILLDDFEEVESLSYTIQDRTCHAPIIIGPGENGTDLEDKLPPGFDINCKIIIGIDGTTVRLDAAYGSAKYYIAHDTYPSEAYYEDVVEAQPGHPGVMYVEHTKGKEASTEEILFCKIISDRWNETDLIVIISPGNEDHCEEHECKNGECIDTGDGYMCKCDEGYHGEYCEEAEQGECGEHGTCVCVCDDGWAGPNCDIEIKECESCEEEEDFCESDPCIRGHCVSDDDDFVCICPIWYTGKTCDVELNPCMSEPCFHGNCTTHPPDLGGLYTPGEFFCICEPDYTGGLCDVFIEPDEPEDICDPNPCINGRCEPIFVIGTEGSGDDPWDPYFCFCEEGWTGRHCDHELGEDSCEDDDDGSGSGSGSESESEEEEEDICDPDPCMNGRCEALYVVGTPENKDLWDPYVCICDDGWSGRHCDEKDEVCDPDPCINGRCEGIYVIETQQNNGGEDPYFCVCDDGWGGRHCDEEEEEEPEEDICNPDPCVNGRCEPIYVVGTPENKDLWDPYICVCDDGWTGRKCDEKEEEDGSGNDDDDEETYDCDKNNPCTDENIAGGNFYFSHEDPSSYVQCDAHGGCFVMDCGPGTVWDQDLLVCVHANRKRELKRDDVISRLQHLKRLLDRIDEEINNEY